ncbi:hypothetical protein V8F20_006738 [Naviculisporaceae sp. PSN 640]
MGGADNNASDATRGSSREVLSRQPLDDTSSRRAVRAKELNLNLKTMRVSSKTGQLLLRGVTDEEMDEKDGGKKLQMMAMWKRWLDEEEYNNIRPIPFTVTREGWLVGIRTTLLEIAEQISNGVSWTTDGLISFDFITALVRNAHYSFIRISYPLQVTVKLLMAWPNLFDEQDLATHRTSWLKGSNLKGRVTIDMIREALEGLCPRYCRNADEWKYSKVVPAVTALERFIESGRNQDRLQAWIKISGIVDRYDINREPTIIRRHLKAQLARADQVNYWATLLNHFKPIFGDYVELPNPSILDPGPQIRLAVEIARERESRGGIRKRSRQPLADEPEPPAKKRRFLASEVRVSDPMSDPMSDPITDPITDPELYTAANTASSADVAFWRLNRSSPSLGRAVRYYW